MVAWATDFAGAAFLAGGMAISLWPIRNEATCSFRLDSSNSIVVTHLPGDQGEVS
jgi:hypothetical protein